MESVLNRERRGAHRHDPFTKEQLGVVVGKVAHRRRGWPSNPPASMSALRSKNHSRTSSGCRAAPSDSSRGTSQSGDTGMRGEHERTAVVGELTNTGVDPVESGGDMAVEGLTGVGQLTAIRGTGEKVPTQTAFEARICRVTAGWVMPDRGRPPRSARRAAASNTASDGVDRPSASPNVPCREVMAD